MQGKTYTFWWALASSALMVIGGFGPWVTFLGFSVGGTEGDGWLVIAAGVIAAGVLLWHDRTPAVWRLVVAGLAGLVALAVSVYDWAEIENVAADADEELAGFFEGALSPGWGLILSALAAASLVVSLIVHHRAFGGGRFDAATTRAEPPPEA